MAIRLRSNRLVSTTYRVPVDQLVRVRIFDEAPEFGQEGRHRDASRVRKWVHDEIIQLRLWPPFPHKPQVLGPFLCFESMDYIVTLTFRSFSALEVGEFARNFKLKRCTEMSEKFTVE